MSNDPGFANDTCIFMEALPHDGGAPNLNDIWWLSPDITLRGPVSGLDNADAGVNNPITVEFHRKPATSGCHFPGDEGVSVEVWVANPSLVMSPYLALSAARVGFIGSPLPAEGATATQQIDWAPPPGLPGTDPQSHGHKCLVARCYPDSGTPSVGRFFVPGDQHVAQHNLSVVSTSSQTFRFTVNTFNPGHIVPEPLVPEEVKLRAVLDLKPNKFVTRVVVSRLQAIPGFVKFRTTTLAHGFAFDLTGLHAEVISNTTPTPPTFAARVVLAERQVTRLTFAANLSGVQSGEACIFHLTQTTLGDVPQGGLTVVVLKL